jgi:hypothetical protein
MHSPRLSAPYDSDIIACCRILRRMGMMEGRANPVCYLLQATPFLAYSSTVKMMATYSFEPSLEFQHTTWRYTPEDKTSLTTAMNTVSYICKVMVTEDRLCGLAVRVLGYRSGGPGSIPGTTRKKSSGSGTGSTQPREHNWGATW